ncbi:MAG: transglutaminase [Verrucomicrobiaceae bacterium]|nr:transglutaminase [Verrucomicrobiaceae bacterium]
MFPRLNSHTFALAAMALAMWYAGEAQKNGGAYILAFLTVSVTVVSWLHAKANLRSLRLEVGTMPTATQGGSIRLPLVLSAGDDGPLPCGLEITAEGAQEPVFVDSLEPEHPTHVSLRVPAGAAGRHRVRHIIVRSRYPLGFFTAQRVFALPRPYLVHPRPAGHLPLPPLAEVKTGSRVVHASRNHGSAGAADDFAGVREWQPGDSLRQVDWKAVARGRPMMVKLWTGESEGVIWLDWAACDAPAEARPSQFAAWMDQAETLGLAYGLRLPAVVIQPAKGIAHRRHCLDELALLQPATQDEAALPGKSQSIPLPTMEARAAMPAKPAALLGLAMMLAALPLLGGVPMAGLLVYYLALGIRWHRQRQGLPPVGQVWRLLLVALGSLGTWDQGGTLYGLEPGVSLLLAVTGAKLLETRNAHDLQIDALLGWFLCLCSLALDQALGRSLFVLAIFALITTALVRLRRGKPGFKASARVTGALMFQALPLVLLLFFFFPRGSGGLVMHLARQFTHRTGISNTLDPGSVAEIAQTPGRAFWVHFPEGNVPDISDRYWRCVVLWNCDGLKWQRGARPSAPVYPRIAGEDTNIDDGDDAGPPLKPKARPPPPPAEPEVRQVITLDPHGGNWLAALDTPVHVMSNVREHDLVASDGLIESSTAVDNVRRYEVGSRKSVEGVPELPASTRAAATHVPAGLSPAVKALAASFKKGRTQNFQFATAALNYFRTQGFRYTLTPDKYPGPDALDTFLFNRKVGFCEHFAASFATLMRQCGVPARVVIGYLGGEYSERWGHYIVHQEDAHAWCELWYEGQGWIRVDPTAELAPGRIGTDLRTYLEGGLDSAFARNRNTWWGRSLTETQLFWDNVNYQWYSRVVQFDEDDQTGLIRSWKLFHYDWRLLALGAVLMFALPMLGLWFWLKRRPRHADPAVRLWRVFCQKLAKAGVPRAGHEAPTTFTARAALALPQAAEQIQAIGKLYVQMRYAGNDSVITEFRQRVRQLRMRERK